MTTSLRTKVEAPPEHEPAALPADEAPSNMFAWRWRVGPLHSAAVAVWLALLLSDPAAAVSHILVAFAVAWIPAILVCELFAAWLERAVPWDADGAVQLALRRALAPLSLLPLAAVGRVLGAPAVPTAVGMVVAIWVALRLSTVLPRPLPASAARRVLLGAFAVLLLPGAFLFQTTVIHDAFQYHATAVSIAIDGDFDTFEEMFFHNSHRSYNPYPEGSVRYLGVPLLELPAVLLGHATARVVRPLGWGFPLNGFSLPYTFWISVLSSTAGVAGVVLTFLWLVPRVGRRCALAAVAIMLWGSALPMFLFLWHGWTHTYSILGVALFLLQRDRIVDAGKGDVAQWCLLGLIGGVLCLIWPVNGLILVLPVFDLSWRLGRAPFGTWPGVAARAVALGGAWIIGFLPQVAGWYGAAGELAGSTYGRVGDFFRWTDPEIVPLLFSWSQHGAFTWHPLLMLACIGLLLVRDARLRAMLLAWVILHIYVVSCWSVWWTGIGFGNRFFLSLLPPLTLGLASGLAWAWRARGTFDRARRATIAALAVALIFVNLSLLNAYRSDVIPMGIKAPSYVQDDPPALSLLARSLFLDMPLTPVLISQDFWVNQSLVMSRVRTAIHGDAAAWLAVVGLVALLALVWGVTIHLLLGRHEHSLGAAATSARPARWRARHTVFALALGLTGLSTWLAFGLGSSPPEHRFLRFDAGETILRPGQRATFVPQGYLEPTREVALISFLTYAVYVPQGHPVAVLRVWGEDGEQIEHVLVAGVHTAETSAQRPEVRAINAHNLAATTPVHEWMTRAYSRAMYPAHAFLARFPLAAPIRVNFVEVEMLHGGGDLVLRDLFLKG